MNLKDKQHPSITHNGITLPVYLSTCPSSLNINRFMTLTMVKQLMSCYHCILHNLTHFSWVLPHLHLVAASHHILPWVCTPPGTGRYGQEPRLFVTMSYKIIKCMVSGWCTNFFIWKKIYSWLIFSLYTSWQIFCPLQNLRKQQHNKMMSWLLIRNHIISFGMKIIHK